jgi:hypothetical protein
VKPLGPADRGLAMQESAFRSSCLEVDLGFSLWERLA